MGLTDPEGGVVESPEAFTDFGGKLGSAAATVSPDIPSSTTKRSSEALDMAALPLGGLSWLIWALLSCKKHYLPVDGFYQAVRGSKIDYPDINPLPR